VTLVVDHGSLFYDDGAGRRVHALQDVSVTLSEGDFLVALGASGCGKTSLLNVMAGFLQLTEGRALVDGEPITRPGRDRGVVFQKDTLFPWLSVEDNVSFGLRMLDVPRRERAARTERILELVGLSEFARSDVWELSGGMRQRASLARALSTEPELLLMDEPFGALDSLTREAMQEFLLNIWSRTRKAIFFITHSIEEALFLGTRVIVMSPRPGRVVAAYDVDFSRQFLATQDSGGVKASPAFVALKEEIRHLIHSRGRLS
jgi:taurine transport system ATP-binding protein